MHPPPSFSVSPPRLVQVCPYMAQLAPKYLIFLLLIIFSSKMFSQNRPKEGIVQCAITGLVQEISKDDSTGIPLSNANIRLLNASDSSTVKIDVSNSEGKFQFLNINQGNYILAVSFVGFTTSYTPITSAMFFKTESIEIGKIILQETSITLDGVVIEAQIPELVIRGDTMEYNPSAFKVHDGAVVEDLLKKLPGLEVNADGRITVASGKMATRVLINGKEFFGNDPTIATRNITVDILDKVQVIEKPTEQTLLTGVDDGEKETVINLTIKPNRMKGWMGNATAGVGTLVDNLFGDGSRYNWQSMLNNFNEKRQISIVANANNTSSQGFSSSAMLSGMGSIPVISGAMMNFGGEGISKSYSFGLNFSTTVNKKLNVNGSMDYKFSDNTSERNSFRTNLLVDSVSYQKSASSSQRTSRDLNFDARIHYQPDSLWTISFSPRISFSFTDSQNHSLDETSAGDSDSTLVNRSNTGTASHAKGFSMSGNLTISRLLSRKGRRFSLTANGRLNHNTNDGTNLSVNEFFLQPDRNKNLNQVSTTSSNSNSYSVNASFVEPIRKNMNLSVSYYLNRNGTLNLKETYDYNDLDADFTILNMDYSKSLKNQYISQTLGFNLNSTNTKHTYNIGFNVLPSSTKSTSFIKDGIAEGIDSILNYIKERKVINYSPRINYTYRFNQQTNLNFSYNGSTRQPSVSQLDPTPDNTNPLYIRSGNPDLLPSFSNFMSLRFSSSHKEKQRTLTTSGDFGFTINEIINFTDYEQGTGIQYTRPINENGTWNAGGNVMYYLPVGSKKNLRLNISTRLNYYNRVGFSMINNRSHKNISGSLSLNESLGLNYNKDWFSGQLNASATHSNTKNSLESRQQQRSSNYRLSFNTNLTLPKTFRFNTDINYSAQRGLTAGYNKNEILWNMSASKQILKKNAGTISFRWTDILRKRQNISRAITANYIEDYAVNSLSSYVFVTFTYRFNRIGK